MNFDEFSIKIPKDREQCFEKLVKLSDNEIESFINAIHEIEIADSLSKLAEKINDITNLPYNDVRDIIKILLELYSLQYFRSIPIEQITESLCIYLKQLGNEELYPINNDWDKFKKNLLEILSQDNAITITAKAKIISNDYEKVLCNSKIYTDIRPIFTSDLEKDKPIASILHTIKIVYHKNAEHKELSIVLDSNNLQNLKKQIQRAENKEKNLINILQDSGFHCFNWS